MKNNGKRSGKKGKQQKNSSQMEEEWILWQDVTKLFDAILEIEAAHIWVDSEKEQEAEIKSQNKHSWTKREKREWGEQEARNKSCRLKLLAACQGILEEFRNIFLLEETTNINTIENRNCYLQKLLLRMKEDSRSQLNLEKLLVKSLACVDVQLKNGIKLEQACQNLFREILGRSQYDDSYVEIKETKIKMNEEIGQALQWLVAEIKEQSELVKIAGERNPFEWYVAEIMNYLDGYWGI